MIRTYSFEELEAISLSLLKDYQAELARVIKAMEGTSVAGGVEWYTFHHAGNINRLADGFILLRTARRFDASKQLVRPAIESIFRILALKENPSTMLRFMKEESDGEEKWLNALDPSKRSVHQEHFSKRWKEQLEAYSDRYPEHEKVERGMNLEAIARVGGKGMEAIYQCHYRLYCRFTHSSFRALSGGFAFTDAEDNRVMCQLVEIMLARLCEIGGVSPSAEALAARRADLGVTVGSYRDSMEAEGE